MARKNDRGRKLTLTVDTSVKVIFVVEFEIEPRSTMRDNPGGVEDFARRVGLTLVVIEDHAWRTVELRYDDALGTVDDERAGFGHERNFAHVNFLFFDVANVSGAGFLIDIVHHETDGNLQRRRERHSALTALVHIVLRFLENVVTFELERGRFIEVVDRENRLENRLQSSWCRACLAPRRPEGIFRKTLRWKSIKLGISTGVAILEKSLRMRRFSEKREAMLLTP